MNERIPRLGVEREIDVVWHVIHQLREDIARIENHERDSSGELSDVTQRIVRVEEQSKGLGKLVWAALTMLLFNGMLNVYALYVLINGR